MYIIKVLHLHLRSGLIMKLAKGCKLTTQVNLLEVPIPYGLLLLAFWRPFGPFSEIETLMLKKRKRSMEGTHPITNVGC